VGDPELNDTDRVVLDKLAEGRNVPKNLADDAGRSRQYIHQRLKILEAADYVENVGNGVYELVDDPRDDADDEPSIDELRTERDRLQERVDALQARLDKHDPEAMPDRDALQRVLRSLEAAGTALGGDRPNVDSARAELTDARDTLRAEVPDDA